VRNGGLVLSGQAGNLRLQVENERLQTVTAGLEFFDCNLQFPDLGSQSCRDFLFIHDMDASVELLLPTKSVWPANSSGKGRGMILTGAATHRPHLRGVNYPGVRFQPPYAAPAKTKDLECGDTSPLSHRRDVSRRTKAPSCRRTPKCFAPFTLNPFHRPSGT